MWFEGVTTSHPLCLNWFNGNGRKVQAARVFGQRVLARVFILSVLYLLLYKV